MKFLLIFISLLCVQLCIGSTYRCYVPEGLKTSYRDIHQGWIVKANKEFVFVDESNQVWHLECKKIIKS